MGNSESFVCKQSAHDVGTDGENFSPVKYSLVLVLSLVFQDAFMCFLCFNIVDHHWLFRNAINSYV